MIYIWTLYMSPEAHCVTLNLCDASIQDLKRRETCRVSTTEALISSLPDLN